MPKGTPNTGPFNDVRNAAIIEMREHDYTYIEIANELKLTRNIVAGVIHRHKERTRQMLIKARYG